MATMSAAPTATTTIRTVNDDARDTWDFSNGQTEAPDAENSASWKHDANGKLPNGNGTPTNAYEFGFEPLPPSRKKPSIDNMNSSGKGNRWDRSNRSSDASTKPPFNIGDKRDAPENIVREWDDENSKWIHRDKLAKIESRELQAAGIVLPRPRATSRPRKGRSQERPTGAKRTTSMSREIPETPFDSEDAAPSRHRKNSSVAENSLSDNGPPSWDLRLPEEIEAEGDGNYWISAGTLGGASKIPVAKQSPLPIPETYIDRSSPSSRRQSDVPADADALVYPKTRSRSGSVSVLTNPGAIKPGSRSVTDISPKKPAPRKTSAPVKTSGSRSRTRGGANKDSTSSSGTTRPSTRSGELSPSVKQPEGDPPWMIGSYKPDPRLPPDQQLLPTVAKRLQQEKWEKEGRYSSIYDKEFRPLTDDALLAPPEASGPSAPQDEEKKHEDWPLKPEARSPTLKQGTSYSTIPKISDKPTLSPLPSPRTPNTFAPPPQQPPPAQKPAPKAPEPEEEKKAGCGCCIIM
ncbi:hypothetical protein F5X68DRAFT_51924 [Plectosphaerella plurivora]|uniref:TeaA receptor TeaR n=1 Tax=Plectosphaerella plurivora TaxID=936078 RepID=A0A9P8V3D3_9PEZI|nr:hypothetical protein F5X68DRAFT_51924 [Plectosphaerella plurivora]